MEEIVTKYAKTGDVHIAYQIFGSGKVKLVFVPGFVSHIENYWTEPNLKRWLQRLGKFARVIMFDKRGTGLSDQLNEMPDMDERLDDILAVMDAENFEKASLFGLSEGGSLATFFAATHPKRTVSLIVFGGYSQFKYAYSTQKSIDDMLQYIDSKWGTGKSVSKFVPSMKDDKIFQQWWGRFERLGASPGAVKKLMQLNSKIDLSDILQTIKVPTLVIHRKDDVKVNVEGGRLLAERIPNAKYFELSGEDHLPWIGENRDQVLDEMERFITGEWKPIETERVLATVLFTDIVDSTKHVSEMGDQRWRDILDSHNSMMYQEIGRFRGRAVKSTGDGFLATFDGPARGIRCALSVSNEAQKLGIEIRAGLHIGEIELIGDDIAGIAVHYASRVMAKAQANEVWVSRTLTELVVGSDFRFIKRGIYDLKGIQDKRSLFTVER